MQYKFYLCDMWQATGKNKNKQRNNNTKQIQGINTKKIITILYKLLCLKFRYYNKYLLKKNL